MDIFWRKHSIFRYFADKQRSRSHRLIYCEARGVAAEDDLHAAGFRIPIAFDRLLTAFKKLIIFKPGAIPKDNLDLVVETVADQVNVVSREVDRSIADLFLNEPFVLGYAVGFAEQAHKLCKTDDESRSAYLRNAIGCMLGSQPVAASFVSFAASKKGDRVFEGGYDAGLRDMKDWHFSNGAKIPSSLSRCLCEEIKKT